MKTIYIKDFISLPCYDSAPAIRDAIDKAKKEKADIIKFEKGVYPLKSSIYYETDQSAHDIGGKYTKEKAVHLLFKDFQNITICGETDDNGEPATLLEGLNDGEFNAILPTVLWVDGGENITIKNLSFTRNPEYCSTGKVTKIAKNDITVEVFEGNPCFVQMGTYCMNKFTSDGNLDGESLSYGPGLGKNFKKIGDNLLLLEDEKISSCVEVGDIITFHQGAQTDFQCFFGSITNLSLENLRTINSNGFAHLAFHIKNLKVNKVRFKPRENQLFTAPRDAFKLHKCQGNIEIDGMEIEGVRMDGQNIHSNYIFPVEIFENKIKFFLRSAYLPIDEGSLIEFYFGTDIKYAKVKNIEYHGQSELDGIFGHLVTVNFDGPIPQNVTEETLCLPVCWEPDKYVCKNSTFFNIAGAGQLSRIDNMHIENCTYKNLMNSGILLGSENPGHAEGGHATNVKISNCSFDNCGNTARYGGMGCIGIKSGGCNDMFNHHIYISDCSFKNSDLGIGINDAHHVYVNNCSFENLKEKIRTDFSTTDKIFVDFND